MQPPSPHFVFESVPSLLSTLSLALGLDLFLSVFFSMITAGMNSSVDVSQLKIAP
jgi:hypothetical protein